MSRVLPVAERWFETRRLADDVTLIWEPHVSPDVRCNIWHVRGRDRDLLVDSGMGMGRLRAEVAMLAERPVAAVASHTHFDHMGGHHEFEERLVHPAEAAILAAPDNTATVADNYVMAEVITALPHAGYDVGRYALAPAPATGLIDEGDEIDLGDRLFKVMHLPGHSPGSIALYEAATATLFAGDVIYDDELFDHLYHSDPAVYAASLERLRTLPVETVHGGHAASFGRDRLIELIDEYLATRGGT